MFLQGLEDHVREKAFGVVIFNEGKVALVNCEVPEYSDSRVSRGRTTRVLILILAMVVTKVWVRWSEVE